MSTTEVKKKQGTVVIRVHDTVPKMLIAIQKIAAVETGGEVLSKIDALSYILQQKIDASS